MAGRIFKQFYARQLVAIDGAARQEDAALHAVVAGGSKQADGAVEIAAAEPFRVIAFAAPITPGDMLEGGMDEVVDVTEGDALIDIRVESERNESDRLREEGGSGRSAAAGNNVIPGGHQMLDDEAADETGATGDEHARHD